MCDLCQQVSFDVVRCPHLCPMRCDAALQEIPDAVCGLQLVLLDFTNNSLRRLPAALGHMTTLRSLPLVGPVLLPGHSAGSGHLICCLP